MSRIVWLAFVVGCSSKHEPVPSPPPAKVAAESVASDGWSALPDLPGTFDISISTNPFDGPPEQRWSWVSGRICGEDDPFLFERPAPDAHRKEGLRCGRALIDHAPVPPRGFVLDVNRAAHEHPLPLFALPTTFADLGPVETLLVGFRRESVGATTVLCRPFDPSTQTCAARHDAGDKAVAVIDGYVIGGAYAALAELLAWSERDRVLALLPSVAARPGIELDLQPRDTKWTIGPRRWLPYSRDEAHALAEVVRTNARAIAHDVAWGLGTGSITLVPRCSTPMCPERAALADALRAYQRVWAAEAPARLAALMNEAPGPEANCMRPLETAMVEQASHAEITARDVVEMRFAAVRTVDPSCKAAEDKRVTRGVASVRAAL